MTEIHEINTVLDGIESQEDVRIVYACESGSRAWGFASQDSDYDVRFIYVRRPEWYLSIHLESKRDVIERPIEGDLDVNGWDIRKALQLFEKSNPPLLEWLGSPIVYREFTATAQRMRDLIPKFYLPRACQYHYWHMAKGNFREFLRRETVKHKKYFYVLRPILAIRWIERDLGVVPTRFQDMVDRVLDDPDLKSAIDELTRKKGAGLELDEGPPIEPISAFLEREFERLAAVEFSLGVAERNGGHLDELFRDSIEAARGGD